MARELFNPGQDVTARAVDDVEDGRLLEVAGPRDGSGQITVTHTAEGARAFGVAGRTRAEGELVHVVRGPGRILEVYTAGSIAAGTDIASGPDGAAVAAGAGDTVVGFAVDDTGPDGFTAVSLL